MGPGDVHPPTTIPFSLLIRQLCRHTEKQPGKFCAGFTLGGKLKKSKATENKPSQNSRHLLLYWLLFTNWILNDTQPHLRLKVHSLMEQIDPHSLDPQLWQCWNKGRSRESGHRWLGSYRLHWLQQDEGQGTEIKSAARSLHKQWTWSLQLLSKPSCCKKKKKTPLKNYADSIIHLQRLNVG